MKKTHEEAFARALKALERVRELEDVRHETRLAGGLLGEIDGRLAAIRTHACGALLLASKAARDSGDHALALDLASEYARQEHLAERLR